MLSNPFSSPPELASDLIEALDEHTPAVDPHPGDMRDGESVADLMYRAGKRDLINDLLNAYKLKGGNDGIPESEAP
ncbi:MAG: hypothetical protein P1V36_06620 [Planctomycetota bacterium]|nr:hypothetical protein [Planctomycetota bacterium]